MTDEQIRIAVAEEMGWQYLTHDSMFNYLKPPKDDFGFCCGKHLSKQDAFLAFCKPNETGVELPDYPNSLDPCAEFEKTLDDDEWYDYYYELLVKVVKPSGSCHNLTVFRATPIQRCEAFLRLRGRYVEDEK